LAKILPRGARPLHRVASGGATTASLKTIQQILQATPGQEITACTLFQRVANLRFTVAVGQNQDSILARTFGRGQPQSRIVVRSDDVPPREMSFGAVSNRRIDAATSYLEVPKLLQSSGEASRYQWVRVNNVHGMNACFGSGNFASDVI
jgi:hypothetical protein